MTPSPHTHRLLALLATPLATMCLMLPAPAQEPESASHKAYQNAKTLYDNGRIADALAAFQAFEAQYEFSAVVPQAICLQGWCWAGMQKYREAINTFDRLRRGYPSASLIPEAILKQAECYRELNNYPMALGLYREFETKYPSHEMLPRALLGEAWTLFKQGDSVAAKATLQKVRTQFASNPATVIDAQFLIAQILTAEKQYEAALHLYEQVPADVNDVRASDNFFLAGEAMFDAGRWIDAIACYKRVQSKASLVEHVRQQIDDLQSRQANDLPRGAPTTYERRLSELRLLLARCEAGSDLGASALFRMANCYQSLGRSEEACAAYSEFLRRYPNDKLAEQARLGLVRELVGRRRFGEAEDAASEFQALYPKSPLVDDVLLLDAEAFFASGRISEALDRFQKLAASNPRLPILEAADFHIGACYYSLHDFDHAHDSLLAFLRQHPNSQMMPDALFRLGRCNFELSQKATDPTVARTDLAAVVTNYEQLRAMYPSSALIPEVTFQLGYLNASLALQDTDPAGQLTTTAHFEKAVALFQEFVNRWPENPLTPEARYQLARNQYALRHFDEAIDSFRKLVEKFPNSTFAPLAACEIANCYGAENKRGEMVAQLRNFVGRYPTDPRVGGALYSIGLQWERDARTDEALAVYRDVIARATAAGDATSKLREAAIASKIRMAGILEARGDAAGAVADCETFLGKFRDDPAVVSAMIKQIAETYRSGRNFHDAYARLDHLAAEYPQNDRVRIVTITSTIELALAAGDSSRAYAAAMRLLGDPEKDRLPASSYTAIADALLRHGQFAEAQEQYEKSLTRNPDDALTMPRARLGLGETALAMNRLDAAENIFGQLVLNTPPGSLHDRADFGLAKVCLARGGGDPRDPHTVKAIELLNAVMVGAKGEDSGEAAYLLGNCYFSFSHEEKENKKTALAYYLRASLLISGPHGEEATFRSGQCHKALGNPQVARRTFEAYLRRFPNGLFAADAKKELESLPVQPQQS